MMLESRALDEVSRHGGRVHDSGLVQLVGEDAAKNKSSRLPFFIIMGAISHACSCR